MTATSEKERGIKAAEAGIVGYRGGIKKPTEDKNLQTTKEDEDSLAALRRALEAERSGLLNGIPK